MVFSRSNSDPLISSSHPARAQKLLSPAHLGRLRHPPGHRSSFASRNFVNSGLAFGVPTNGLACTFQALEHPTFVAIPVPGLPRSLDSDAVLTADHAKFFSITQAR
jgi:hypothetical protein